MYPRHLRDLSGSLYYGVEWNIKLFLFNGDFHDYYERSRNGIRKSSATRRWVHWSLVNFSCNIWNRLDISLKEAETLSSFFDYIRIQFLVSNLRPVHSCPDIFENGDFLLFSEKYSNPHIACCIFAYPLENAKRREIREEASVFKNLISEAPRLKTCPFWCPKTLFTCGRKAITTQKKKNSVFKNIGIRVDGAFNK